MEASSYFSFNSFRICSKLSLEAAPSETKLRRSKPTPWKDIPPTGAQTLDLGSWITDQGSWIMDQGSMIMDHGSWVMDHGSRIKDQGSRTLFWHEHPGRDTGVISRLSKSTIEDLSFHIGFTRIGLRIKDLGPWTFFWHE